MPWSWVFKSKFKLHHLLQSSCSVTEEGVPKLGARNRKDREVANVYARILFIVKHLIWRNFKSRKLEELKTA